MIQFHGILSPFSRYYDEMSRLYSASFPENECVPLPMLMERVKEYCEIFAFTEEESPDRFLGFITVYTTQTICHIVYFATIPEMRGKGIGSKVLDRLKEMKSGHIIIADLERTFPGCPNPAQRDSRRSFYLRNGFLKTSVEYRWHGEEYEILSFGGDISEKDFDDFWEEVVPSPGDY